VNRPWIVRNVALLLVLVGLQAGSFRDLDTGHEWFFGTEDASAAVMSEARKADPSIDRLPAASAPSAFPVPVRVRAALRLRAAPESSGAPSARAYLPSPTGPPRA
jgi:hypothetical protein